MAENENGQEKTEQPTSKKLEKAREEGQVPRSKELGTTLVLVGAVAGLMIFGQSVAQALHGVMVFNFDLSREALFDPHLMVNHLGASVSAAFQALFPVLMIMAVAAIVGPIALGGWLFSAKAMAPKFERLNPLEGIKRMFSANSMVELVKSIGKFALLSTVAVLTLLHFKTRLLGLSGEPLHTAMVTMLSTIGWCALAVSGSMILISLIDVPYQLFQHNKELRMTRQEIKDEMKDVEGKPEVKRRVRQLQMEFAYRRMMEAVPEADVVITNPEHFSVALKYEVGGSGAPVVVAKGADLVALKIREIANAHQVQILEIPPLARAVYFTTDLNQQIPGKLYLAVAQVLAYVFQLKAYRQGAGRKPRPLGEVNIPDDAYYDHRGRRQQSSDNKQ